MTTQHNCPHMPAGWCLECVGALAAERDAAVAEKRRLLELYVRTAPLIHQRAEELVSLAKWMESARAEMEER